MYAAYPKMERRPIRQLDAAAANRIAAGEVVERPAAAVKELIENALDAGARRIDVAFADGGKRLIRVADDGHGMAPHELPLALARHATSKLDGTDLTRILSFGFRGEALPSLGAVGRLTLASRAAEAAEGAQVTVRGGVASAVRPAALARGTVVELEGLFSATPARLKFLRSDRAEAQAIAEVVRRLALAAPATAFSLSDLSDPDAPREILRLQAEAGDLFEGLRGRLRAILGPDFVGNALALDAEREGLHLGGYAALPTYSRGAAVAQHLFVNLRPVRDKLLLGALRAAYADLLPRDRHAAAALYLSCPPEAVDVNVHPAKAELRFRDPGLVRGLVIGTLKAALAGAGHRGSTTTGAGMLGAFRPGVAPAAWPRPAAGFAELGAAWAGRVEPAPGGGSGRGGACARRAAARGRPGAAARDLHRGADRRRRGDRRPARRARAAGLRAAEGGAGGGRHSRADAADPRDRRARPGRERAARAPRRRSSPAWASSSSRSGATRSACARPPRRSARWTRRGCSPTSPTRWRKAGAGSRPGSTRSSRAWPATARCAPAAACRARRWTRSCARWRRRRIPASATTAARPISN